MEEKVGKVGFERETKWQTTRISTSERSIDPCATEKTGTANSKTLGGRHSRRNPHKNGRQIRHKRDEGAIWRKEGKKLT